MPRGKKSSSTSRQKRMDENIEEGYENRGTRGRKSGRSASATMNRETAGGRKQSPARKKAAPRKTSAPSMRTPARKAGTTPARGRKSAAPRTSSRKK
jgi:hypothetical protein